MKVIKILILVICGLQVAGLDAAIPLFIIEGRDPYPSLRVASLEGDQKSTGEVEFVYETLELWLDCWIYAGPIKFEEQFPFSVRYQPEDKGYLLRGGLFGVDGIVFRDDKQDRFLEEIESILSGYLDEQ